MRNAFLEICFFWLRGDRRGFFFKNHDSTQISVKISSYIMIYDAKLAMSEASFHDTARSIQNFIESGKGRDLDN
jgi:hypothetical protein